MFEKIIFYGAISVAVTLAMSYLNSGANKSPSNHIGENIQIRMNKLYSIIGYIGLGISIAFSIGSIFFYEQGIEVLCVLIWVILGGPGIACLLYHKNHKVDFDNDQFSVSNWRGKTNTYKWRDITEVQYKPISGYLKVSDSSNSSKIHSHLIGLGIFIDRLDNLTKFKKNKLKLPYN